ncbi:MAG: hypothetical protein ABR581_00835 [Thermoleophilaceae bacterium]
MSTRAPKEVPMEDTIIIRHSTDQDGPAIARLAALDSRPAPSGPALLALVDGELRAALVLGDGEVVADPFKPTAWLARLLRLRVAGERPGAVQRSRGRGARWRLGLRTGEARA